MCCFVCVEGSDLQDLNSTAKNYGRCTELKVVRATEEPRWIPLCSVDAGWASYTMATMEWLERIVLVFEAQVDTGGKISPSCSWRSICRIDPFTCLTRFQAQTRFVIFVDILQRGRDCAVSGFIVSSLLFLPHPLLIFAPGCSLSTGAAAAGVCPSITGSGQLSAVWEQVHYPTCKFSCELRKPSEPMQLPGAWPEPPALDQQTKCKTDKRHQKTSKDQDCCIVPFLPKNSIFMHF